MNLMRRMLLILPGVALWALAPAAGVSAVRNGYVSLEAMEQKQADAAKHLLLVPPAVSGVTLYKLRYPSVDGRGAPAQLSALLMLPSSGAKGLVLYDHGTIYDRNLSPSRYTGLNKLIEPEYVMMAFAAGGYAVLMPDYAGLGDSPGTHWYPGGEENVRSGADAINPARMIARQHGISVGKPLFITGYSQGGLVAMCTVRKLELSNSPVLTAAAPMSGPYDLSGETAKSMLKGGLSLEGLGSRLFLLGYAAYSTSKNLGTLDLSRYFAPSFASYVPYVFGQKLNAVGIAKKLVGKALQMGALNSVGKVLTKEFRNAIQWEDASNPIISEMMRSNCYDWAPRTKMLLPYLKGDDVVVETNTLKAVDSMRFRGVGPDRLRAYPIEHGKLNHTTAAAVAYSAARRFFDGGFAAAFAINQVAESARAPSMRLRSRPSAP